MGKLNRSNSGAASAASAWSRGLSAANARNLEFARLWLERAVKLAPADPRIGLDLANVRIAINTKHELAIAIRELERLSEDHHAAAILLALMSAQHLAQAAPAAAATLTRLLQHHCVPEDQEFGVVAGMIATAAGLPGWCGILPSGALHIGCAGPLEAALNGQPVSLPGVMPGAGHLRLTHRGQPLAGSPLDLAAFSKVAGIATAVDGGLTGWAFRPAAPDEPPALTLHDAAGTSLLLTPGNKLPPDEAAPFARKFSFAVPATKLKHMAPPFRLTGPDGRDIMGSPLDPAALASLSPVPAAYIGPANAKMPTSKAPLSVIIPLYRNLAFSQACLASVQADLPAGAGIILIDDASPEPELSIWASAQQGGSITLIRHAENQGFAAAVNSGLALTTGHDVLLLNSDTVMPPGALAALIGAAYAAPDIGSATPLSNEATILSVPDPNGNRMPDLEEAAGLQRAAAAANGGQIQEIPTGIGFCLLMRHDCLAATGGLRPEIFGQGYGEENDWCLRARHLGYRHVAALGAYVAHHGRSSFQATGQALNARNAGILNRLYPGYDRLIAGFIAADPLAPARRRFDAARFAQGRRARSVLLISHNHGGGVARIVTAGMQSLRTSGIRPLLLIPGAPADLENTPFPWDAELTDGQAGDYPHLRFKLPDDYDRLLALLRAEAVAEVIFHHGLGHHPAIRKLAADLGVPQDIVLHDYASFCPRVNLLSHRTASEPLRYCGEPSVQACEVCVEIAGDETFEYLGPAALIARSRAEFAAARRITTPSADAAARIARHFPGVRPAITPWQDDTLAVNLTPPQPGPRRIAVIGGIGPAKGYDILIACAMDAQRRKLALEFIVAGTSADDQTLLETGGIFVTGAYREGHATAMIQSLNASLAFLPSIWPETWCFALSEAWAAGLYSVAFDLGAQSARLKATGRGAVLPLGLPVPRINDFLLAWMPDLSQIAKKPHAPKALETKLH